MHFNTIKGIRVKKRMVRQMSKNTSAGLVETFKNELIKNLKEETEQEIIARVNEFEQHLREMTSAKIVSFVDKLKVVVSKDSNSCDPKIIIEVHL